MPTIESEETVKVSIDVEVFCNTCGCGLCGETIVKGKQYPQFRVNVCPDCEKSWKSTLSEITDRMCELEKLLDQKTDECDYLIRELKQLEK